MRTIHTVWLIVFCLCVSSAGAQKFYGDHLSGGYLPTEQSLFIDYFPRAFYEVPLPRPGTSRVFPAYDRFYYPAFKHAYQNTEAGISSTSDPDLFYTRDYDTAGYLTREQKITTITYADAKKTTEFIITAEYHYSSDRNHITITNTSFNAAYLPPSAGINTDFKQVCELYYSNTKLIDSANITNFDSTGRERLETVKYLCNYDSLHRLSHTNLVARWDKKTNKHQVFDNTTDDKAHLLELYTYAEIGISDGRYVSHLSYEKADSAYTNIIYRYIPGKTPLRHMDMFDDLHRLLYHCYFNDTLVSWVVNLTPDNEDYEYTRYPDRRPPLDPNDFHSHDEVNENILTELSIYNGRLSLRYSDAKSVSGSGHADWSYYNSSQNVSFYFLPKASYWKYKLEGRLVNNDIETTLTNLTTTQLSFMPDGQFRELSFHEPDGKEHQLRYKYVQWPARARRFSD